MTGRKVNTDSIKREVVREVKLRLLSKAASRMVYDIPGTSTITGWIRNIDGETTNPRMIMDYKKSDNQALISRIMVVMQIVWYNQTRHIGPY